MRCNLKIIIATVALFSMAAYCFGQSTSANWKTYNNEKYGFSFQYPEKWVMDTDSDVTVSGTVTARSIQFSEPITKTLLIIQYTLSKATEIYNFYISNYDSAHSKKIKVDGNEAIQITAIDKKNGKGKLLNRKDWQKEINVEFLDKDKTGEFEFKYIAYMNTSLAAEMKKFNYLLHSFKILK